ncbi:D-amino-acid transaminase [Virgibacillus sp. NKC19-3]|uniref:D-amino-acid transaminase n=1 Tax=Virgibacillus saliphilus TaxID=2831674 RepID=UPI001C9BAB2D|nr:D-amino-acid transaminase [Virgibacillus sp. NKC19-3]MBY7142947.1 D-amino-acid transaminase [Virgibacillus sp. NKC19-3]
MAKMLFHDQIIERESRVNIEDRAYQFGDGIYEVIGVYDGKPFMMDEHLDRLKRSANEIQLKLPYQMDDFRSNLEELVENNELYEGIIYLQVSRGVGPRWHEFPDPDVSPVTVAYTRAEERKTDLEEKGGVAVLTEDIRWLRCDIKTLNLLPNVLAKQKAVEHNAVEAILHRDGIVTEASASNVFMVKDGTLYTHPANNYILNGITRQKIIERCDALDMKVNEEPFTVDDMLAADEVFITATKSDIIPILQIDNHKIAAGVPGAMTLRILEEFRSLIRELTET